MAMYTELKNNEDVWLQNFKDAQKILFPDGQDKTLIAMSADQLLTRFEYLLSVRHELNYSTFDILSIARFVSRVLDSAENWDSIEFVLSW